MKKHLCTIILLLIAIVAFLFGFKVSGICKTVCDLMAFALPTIAAVVEVMLSEKSSRRIEEEFNKIYIYKEKNKSVSVENIKNDNLPF